MLKITAASPFTWVFVTLDGTTQGIVSSSDSGLGSFFEVTLPAAQTTTSLLLAFPQVLPTSSFDLFFAVVDDSGDVGPFSTVPFRVVQVWTGDVQVTLFWDSDSDVDLHVVDPSGGELDLDSDAACSLDDVRNENITWPVGSAPQGTYSVRVDYWSSCDVAETNYTVLVNNGRDIQSFTGRFTGPGDRGGRGSGVEITTFERSTGPTALATRAAPAEPEGPTTKR